MKQLPLELVPVQKPSSLQKALIQENEPGYTSFADCGRYIVHEVPNLFRPLSDGDTRDLEQY